MFEKRTPVFTKGRILKKEMLESLRDFPRYVTDIFLAPYVDGVISGLDLTVDQENIMIAPGIIKYQGQLLLLGEVFTVPYQANGGDQILKLRMEAAYQTEDFEGRKVEVLLENGLDLHDHELELARFKLKEGAYLRSDYQGLSDFLTGYNTLNIVHQPYSSVEEITLHPAILRYFARELLACQTENPADLNICFQVLNQNQSISKELLTHYIRMRLKQPHLQLEDHVSLHQKLIKVLELAKSEQRRGTNAPMSGRKMIVD